MNFDYALAYRALPYLAQGTMITLAITCISYLLGLVGGIVIGYLYMSKHYIIRIPIALCITLIRGTPMLVQISFFYYVLPFLGVNFSAFWAATIAIGTNSAIYMSQIIKSGINGVGIDQREAAQVLGFTRLQTARYIIIPQALRIAYPSLVNEYIVLLKDSSLASVIGVMELYKESQVIMNQSYDVMTVFCLVSLIYLILTVTIEKVARIQERKINWYVEN